MIDEQVLARVLGTALRGGGEFAEVFGGERRSSSARLEDAKVEELTSGRERGAGVRVVAGATTGYAHTTDLSEAGLLAAAEVASAAARAGGAATRVIELNRGGSAGTQAVEVRPEDVAKARKVELLLSADEAARRGRAAVAQVSTSTSDNRRRTLIANSDGLLVEDDVTRTRFGIQCVAQGDTGLQTGSRSIGAAVGFELFDRWDVEQLAAEAADTAIRKLAARPAPAGVVPVVLAAGGGGVLFHEACGHGLEADLVEKDSSAFRGRVGTRVASSLVTLIDDATVAGEWGSFAVDDEGAPAQRTLLIDEGILQDYMWDLVRARRAGRQSTGNGRRETYQHLPMVRMTNTFLAPNPGTTLDDLIGEVDDGVFCRTLGGGQVNTATGDFVFGMTEAYLIEGGRVTEPLRAANLIGNGPQALLDIEGLADDFDMGWPGTCGKDGQGVPVGMGIPSLRIGGLTVGGTAR
ncbi:MAG: TldD protein, part of TldE/TldD proteolytic complex [uncultured Acidimicrobiales bacterium]|uniref:TldD protein, part of TldE/TldD proteolytic complex n=1 Tax=uncultured Acidimicrobiales bacterium TaxID=310071 RepID=A0A6J4HRS4_9ACTN|nr:MAG: TldD protein, part of TldE/TldD proteolytic complex [uncultured Acidimicrobiales bacterium]